MGQGHEGLRLIGGISEHDSLVTGTDVLQLGGIDRLGDIGGLLLDGHNHVAGAVVQTLGDVVVADVLQGLTDDQLVVNGGRGGDLTEDHDHAGLGAGLAGNTRGGVLTDAGIQHGVGDLITDLV